VAAIKYISISAICLLSLTIFGENYQEKRLACFYYDNIDIYEDSSIIHPGLPWVWAKDENGEQVYLLGKESDGFFYIDYISGISTSESVDKRNILMEFCNIGLQRYFPTSYKNKTLLKMGAKNSFLSLYSLPLVYFDEPDNNTVERMVIFGDSMSDTGNLKTWLRIFPREPYFAGRFSNGPIWVDYFGLHSSISIQNWALGGLISKSSNINNTMLDSIKLAISSSADAEIKRYYQKSLYNRPISKPKETLFFIWVGGNDYLNKMDSNIADIFLDQPEYPIEGLNDFTTTVASNIIDNIDMLYQVGARKFLLANLPNLGLLPRLKHNKTYHMNEDKRIRLFKLSQKMTQVGINHNLELARLVDEYKAKHPDVTISLMNINQVISNILNQISLDGNGVFDYGLRKNEYATEITHRNEKILIGNECYLGNGFTKQENQVCSAPSQKIFWDYAHPTTFSHCLLGAYIHQFSGEHGIIAYNYWQNYLQNCYLKPLGISL
jgi:thermolabile hemolysin